MSQSGLIELSSRFFPDATVSLFRCQQRHAAITMGCIMSFRSYSSSLTDECPQSLARVLLTTPKSFDTVAQRNRNEMSELHCMKISRSSKNGMRWAPNSVICFLQFQCGFGALIGQR